MSNDKRQDEMPISRVQQGNRSWWTRNTMSYDWNAKIQGERFTLPWFDEADARFVWGARLFATEKQPFDKFIPFEAIKGARVLEIGCGMGFHTELLARAGAEVTSVDLSPTSVAATRQRMKLKSLNAVVVHADAERLPFGSGSFDFVWSWGVIHHSSRTARIVREIARVTKPDGECRIMVYNRAGMPARIAYFKDYLLKFKFLRYSFEEILYRSTDGFSARFYISEQFEDLFRAFFAEVSSEICGQDADAIPLPAVLRRAALKIFPERYLKNAQKRRGAFIFLRARHLD